MVEFAKILVGLGLAYIAAMAGGLISYYGLRIKSDKITLFGCLVIVAGFALAIYEVIRMILFAF